MNFSFFSKFFSELIPKFGRFEIFYNNFAQYGCNFETNVL